MINPEYILYVPTDETQYQAQQAWIDDLLDTIGEDEQHPLASLLHTLGTLSREYELNHVEEPQADAIAVLQFLMAEHALKQSDLGEIGSQSVISEILSGKRQLNVRQILQLSDKFHVSPAVFL